MICPVCHAEYVPGRTECSDCHVALVEPTDAPETVLADDDAVEVATTSDASVARGWRDVMTASGVAHRIGVSGDPETLTTYTLLADELDTEWAVALAEVVDERPAVPPAEAVRLAGDRMNAGPVYAFEADAGMFDVSDLLPPPEVRQQIDNAKARASIGFQLAGVFCLVALDQGPWWCLVAVIAVVEALRARRRAAARLAEWEKTSGWEPPTR